VCFTSPCSRFWRTLIGPKCRTKILRLRPRGPKAGPQNKKPRGRKLRMTPAEEVAITRASYFFTLSIRFLGSTSDAITEITRIPPTTDNAIPIGMWKYSDASIFTPMKMRITDSP